MLTDLQTVKSNQYETVDKVNQEYNPALIAARLAINEAGIAINKERGIAQ